MPKKILINNVEYIPASRAGKLVGYTPDYISKLAREDKIKATRNGRHWYVDLASVESFKLDTEAVKHKRAKEIRAERKLEQKLYQHQEVNLGTPFLAAAQTLVVVFLGFWIGLGGYFVTVNSELQQAQISHNVFENLAITVYKLFSPDGAFRETTEAIEFTENEQMHQVTADASLSTTTYTSLIIAPDELFTEAQVAEVRDSFSDEVEISIDPEHPDMGIITPIFKERRGEEYRFLMMPTKPFDIGS